MTNTSSEIDLSLQHLQASLARLDVRIQREVFRWQQAGQDPADEFRGLYIPDAEAGALLARPFAFSWGQTSPLPQDEQLAFAVAEAQARQQEQEICAEAGRQGYVPRLQRLVDAFGLSRFEMDALLICLAPALDLRYERLFGYLQDDVSRRRPSINLVLNLLAGPGLERFSYWPCFAEQAPLFKFYLLERISENGRPGLLNQALQPDEGVVAWLLGEYQPQRDIAASILFAPDVVAGPIAHLCRDYLTLLEPALAHKPVVVFYGPDRALQKASAALIAERLGQPLLLADLETLLKGELSPLTALRLVLREARLTGALPYLMGWEACLGEDGAPDPEVLAGLLDYPEIAILGGSAAWQARGLDRQRQMVWINFMAPAYRQRVALWQYFLKDHPNVTSLDIETVAGQFNLTTQQIRDACASSGDLVIQQGGPGQAQDLLAAARAQSDPGLSSLARKITPRYRWADIVLPEDPLELLGEIIAAVRSRPQVLDDWGVSEKLASSRGVTVLFAGPSGTGKTMAAEIIANQLGLDLYKIDLSGVVSKYIGETEKNLERIFASAEDANAILFFDEADALFGKRSEVRDSHDRYANIEISYLLQRMEAYGGVTILATNLRANLDEAFTRRLQFAVDFPFPDEQHRLRIWQALFPPGIPRDPALDFHFMAQRFKLAGGNIRNVIVNAAYLAAADGGQVTMTHLLHGMRRELQKIGRLIGDGDLTTGA